MRKPSAQPQNQTLDYSTLALNYLYLQSVRRNTSMAKLPPDILKALGCTVEHNGIGISFIRVKEPKLRNGRSERRKQALTRIWMSKKNDDVFGYFPHRGKQKPKKEKEEEHETHQPDDADEAMMQVGLARKDILALKRVEPVFE